MPCIEIGTSWPCCNGGAYSDADQHGHHRCMLHPHCLDLTGGPDTAEAVPELALEEERVAQTSSGHINHPEDDDEDIKEDAATQIEYSFYAAIWVCPKKPLITLMCGRIVCLANCIEYHHNSVDDYRSLPPSPDSSDVHPHHVWWTSEYHRKTSTPPVDHVAPPTPGYINKGAGSTLSTMGEYDIGKV